MGVAENKYQAKQAKRAARGRQQTRFFCEPCGRQCLDAHGWSLHLQSQSHLQNVAHKVDVLGKGSATQLVDHYSDQFAGEFAATVPAAWTGANSFYIRHTATTNHTHLNATKWPSLTAFLHWAQQNRKLDLKPGPEGGEKWFIRKYQPPVSVKSSKKPKNPTSINVATAPFEDVPLHSIDDIVPGNQKIESQPQNENPQSPSSSQLPPSSEPVATAKPLGSKGKVKFSIKKK